MALAIGGDVTAATRAGVDAHVAGCPDCRAEFEKYRESSEALSLLRLSPEPPAGWPGIWAGIAEHVGPGGPLRAVADTPTPVAPAATVRGFPMLRLAAGLLVGFTAGFTVYHIGYRAPAGSAASPIQPVVTPETPVAAPLVRVLPPTADVAWQDRLGAQLGLHPREEMGWTVRTVMPGSAAEAAGLRADDAVLAINGHDLPRSPAAMEAMMRELSGVADLRLRLRRGEAVQDVVLKLR
jgi:hypothetical protein